MTKHINMFLRYISASSFISQDKTLCVQTPCVSLVPWSTHPSTSVQAPVYEMSFHIARGCKMCWSGLSLSCRAANTRSLSRSLSHSWGTHWRKCDWRTYNLQTSNSQVVWIENTTWTAGTNTDFVIYIFLLNVIWHSCGQCKSHNVRSCVRVLRATRGQPNVDLDGSRGLPQMLYVDQLCSPRCWEGNQTVFYIVL